VKLTTHHLVPRSKNEWSYTPTPPIRLHGVVLSLSTGTALHFTLTTLILFSNQCLCLQTGPFCSVFSK